MIEYKLPDSAIDYVKDVLSYDSPVCKFAKDTPFEAANTYLPKETSTNKLESYSSGGIVSPRKSLTSKYEKVKDTSDWLSNYIYQSMLGDSSYCIIDDVMASDNELLDNNNTALKYGNGVLHVLNRENTASVEDVRKVIFAAKVSWHFVCLVVQVKEKFRSKTKTQSDFKLEKDVLSITEVIVGAYDGEAYIIGRTRK
ncbi:hypothetical protein [Aliikangiella maris]|uniref:Uncharacterized protein n=2 Tax=Aliikangiella maris TaxID=3162458 RepID=A0ABV3MVG3_9GAMM